MNKYYHDFSRRSANLLLAGAAVLLVKVSTMASTRHQSVYPKSLYERLVNLFDDPSALSTIGSVCLESLPLDQRSTDQLVDTIVSAAKIDTHITKGRQGVRYCVARQVQREFADGDIVNIDGWWLSVTEARLYALVFLSMDRIGNQLRT